MATRRRRSLMLWSAVALSAGWVGVGVDRLLASGGAERPPGGTPGMAVWLITPVLATAVYRLIHRDLHVGLRPRGSARDWAVAALAFPAVTAAALALGAALGDAEVSSARPAVLVGAAATALVPALVKNILEELCWRGTLVSELVRGGVSDLRIYLVSGGVWGLWHLPYHLHLLPEEDLRTILDVPRPVFAGLAVATMLAWGVLFAELYRASGSVWTVVLLHTVQDSVITPLVASGHVVMDTPTALAFSPVVGVVPAVSCAGLGLRLRRSRRAREVR